MTTLDDLLLKLPDNSAGAISAQDIRDVVTALWEAGAAVEARTSALELEDTAGATISLTGIWTANPTPGAEPSTLNSRYEVTSDTGTFGTATWLRFRPEDKAGLDFTAALQAAQAIFAQQKADSRNWVRYSIQSAAVVGAYVQVEVTPLGNSGGDTGAVAWEDAIVALSGIPSGIVGA